MKKNLMNRLLLGHMILILLLYSCKPNTSEQANTPVEPKQSDTKQSSETNQNTSIQKDSAKTYIQEKVSNVPVEKNSEKKELIVSKQEIIANVPELNIQPSNSTIKKTTKSDKPNIKKNEGVTEVYKPKVPKQTIPGVVKFKKDGKWGFVDNSGKIIIECLYDMVGDYSEGYAAVKRNGKWGFIDRNGRTAVPCNYDMVLRFSESMAPVKRNGKYGFVDGRGTEVVPCKYDGVKEFEEGMAMVKRESKIGYIDGTGKEIIKCIYNSGFSFHEGMARVAKAGKWGYINKKGEEVVSIIYDAVWDFSEGMAGVKKGKYFGFVNVSGKEININYLGVLDFYEGYGAVKSVNGWGFINSSGTEIIPCRYDAVWPFFKGKAKVQKDGKVYYIDATEKEVPGLSGM